MEIALQKARVAVVGVKPVDGDRPACPRCLQFEDELRELRQRLMDSGRYVAFSPVPNPNPNVESELQRWLSVNPRADAAAGFRAGWTRLARFIAPRLREWESCWRCAMRDNNSPRSRIGVLLTDIERSKDSG